MIKKKIIDLLQEIYPNGIEVVLDEDGEIINYKVNEETISSLIRELQGDTDSVFRETYGLNWLGKSLAQFNANDRTSTYLTEDKEYNQLDENKNSRNIYIYGDNLDALKHFQLAYSNKVKMIYIDPPYNTENDRLVYNDKFKYTPEKLSEAQNISIDEAKKILEYLPGKSHHSAWLTVMYPRLLLARELLKEDGVIFISIDEHEQAQLKLLCDEIFGENNFVTEFVWKSRSSMQYSETLVSSQTESILLYAKNKSVLSEEGFNKVKKDTDKMSYANPDNDPNGKWTSSGIVRDDGRKKYKLTSPSGKTFTKPWLYTEENMQKLIDQGVIYWGVNGDAEPRKKNYWNDYDGKPSSNLLQDEYIFYTNKKDEIKKKKSFEIGITQSGTAEVKKHFGIKMFDYPKPVSLIQYLISLVKLNDDDIVMDFFSGSGTTAEAVLNLNAEDGIKRKFVLVQLPEPIKETQQNLIDFCVNELKEEPVIPNIACERIRRASSAIKEKLSKNSHTEDLDLGFKKFYIKDARDIKGMPDQLSLGLDIELEDEVNNADRLLTWAVRDGLMLDEVPEPILINNYTAYAANNILYLIDAHFSNDDLNKLIEMIDNREIEINRIVYYNPNFSSSIIQGLTQAINTKPVQKISISWRIR